MTVDFNPQGKTLSEKYPTCEPLYLVDTAVTVEPQSLQELKKLTGLTVPDIRKALSELMKMGLIVNQGKNYWAE